jgi:hypothetical protein
MNDMKSALTAQIQKIGADLQSGVLPSTTQNIMHLMDLKSKLDKAKALESSQAAQQLRKPTVKDQIVGSAVQEARQASVEDMMRERARMMQDEMGQTGGISDFLPKPAEEAYAKGGPIAFDEGGLIEKRLKFIREHGLAGTVGNAYNQAYGWSSDLARSAVDPRTYQNIYSGLRDEYSDLDDATKKILWGVPDEPQEAKPTINPKDLVAQARAKPFGESNLPMLEGYGNNLMPVAIDRRAPAAQPAPIIDKAELVKPQIGGADQRTMAERMQLRPAQVGSAAPSRTPYAQVIQPSAPAVGAGAPPAQQAQPQQEERDQSLSDYMKQYREAAGENKGIGALQNRLSEREARLAKEEDRIPGMVLMQGGIAMMAGPSSNAMTNIAHGLMSGSQTYINLMNKLEDAKDKSFDIQAKLEDAHRAEELAAAKYGLESVQADKKAKQTARLEREKMANDVLIHDRTNAAHLEAARIGKEATLGAAQTRAEVYAGTGKPTKLTDQQNYFNRVVEALEANPTWRPDLRHADGSPNPIAIEAERKKTSTDRRMEGFMGDSMGTSMGSGMMSTQPDPRYRLSQQ